MFKINNYRFENFKCQADLHKSNYAVLLDDTGKGIKYAPYSNFSDEYNMLKALNHTQIPTVYDIGQGRLYKDNKFLLKQNFIVLQHIDGYDMVDYFKEKDVENTETIHEVIQLFITICDALQYLHSRHYVHCDLKPGHLIIDKKTKLVCLIDFELAISCGEAIRGISREYASPEQLQMLAYFKSLPGEDDYRDIPPDIRLDGKTDLYSTGLILYQIVTKNLWLTKKTLPSKINIHVPMKLEEIIMNLLEENPAQRTQSAEELKKALLKI